MKSSVVLQVALFSLCIGIISCDNDNELQPDFISANLNAQSWKALPELTIDTRTDTLTLLGVGNEQVIAFKLKFNGEGVYDLSGTQANYYTTVGGDALTSLYTLGETASSQITITAYNSEQNTIKGNFEIVLVKEWSNPENDLNELNFTQGRFKATITN